MTAACRRLRRAQDSAGTRHLAALAAAGVTHVHLLPVYDFGSVDELRETWREPAAPDGQPLASFPPDSEVQQAAVMAVADVDGYNWRACGARPARVAAGRAKLRSRLRAQGLRSSLVVCT